VVPVNDLPVLGDRECFRTRIESCGNHGKTARLFSIARLLKPQ
jgi:hypothetical protein